MSLKIFFFIGIVVFVLSTVGYASNLGTTPTLYSIGSDDNNTVSAPTAYITNVVLTESSNDIVSSTITVKNSDVDSHSYTVCIITKAGVLISDTPGSTSDCSDTPIISSGGTDSVTINFSNPLSSSSVDHSNISIQEIT